jgi:hypothetical protein
MIALKAETKMFRRGLMSAATAVRQFGLAVAVMASVVGCDARPVCVRSDDVGTFVSVEKQPSAWNEPIIVKVVTTKGEFLLFQCTASGTKDDVCVRQEYSDGTAYLFIGKQHGHRIQ